MQTYPQLKKYFSLSILVIMGSNAQSKNLYNSLNITIPGAYSDYLVKNVQQANQVPQAFIQSIRFKNSSNYPNSTYSWQNSAQPLYVSTMAKKFFFHLNPTLSLQESSLATYEAVSYDNLKTINFSSVYGTKNYKISIEPKNGTSNSNFFNSLMISPQSTSASNSKKFTPYMGDDQVMPIISFDRFKGTNDDHYLMVIQAKFPQAYGNPSTDYTTFNSSIIIDEKELLTGGMLKKLTGLEHLFYYTLNISYDVLNLSLSLDSITFAGWMPGQNNLQGTFSAHQHYISKSNNNQFITGIYDLSLAHPYTTLHFSYQNAQTLQERYEKYNTNARGKLITTLNGLYVNP